MSPPPREGANPETIAGDGLCAPGPGTSFATRSRTGSTIRRSVKQKGAPRGLLRSRRSREARAVPEFAVLRGEGGVTHERLASRCPAARSHGTVASALCSVWLSDESSSSLSCSRLSSRRRRVTAPDGRAPRVWRLKAAESAVSASAIHLRILVSCSSALVGGRAPGSLGARRLDGEARRHRPIHGNAPVHAGERAVSRSHAIVLPGPHAFVVSWCRGVPFRPWPRTCGERIVSGKNKLSHQHYTPANRRRVGTTPSARGRAARSKQDLATWYAPDPGVWGESGPMMEKKAIITCHCAKAYRARAPHLALGRH